MILLVLSGCTGRGRYIAMRNGLDSLNQLNCTGQTLTTADVQPYVDFFNFYGNSNDQLLVHYLLGRAYHEHGEAPMALQSYQEAALRADTTSADCDYRQLSRVYSQMADIFYHQHLYRKELTYDMLAEECAWKGQDTLAALMNKEQQSLAYRKIGMNDSAVIIAENVAGLYERYGYTRQSAIALGSILRYLLMTSDYEKLRLYIIRYENNSGLFDKNGNIEKGREIYYNIKGIDYLQRHLLDSAEYYFRKELREGKDFNNQNAGAYSLAMLYEQCHHSDSAAKYYRYAYAMNDSMYSQQATATIERMQAMYDYSRHQEQAYRATKLAARIENMIWGCVGVIFLMVLAGAFIYERLTRKRQEMEARYLHSLEIIKQARRDIEILKDSQADHSQLIAEKEKCINEQKGYLRTLPIDSLIFKQFIVKGQKPAEEEWQQIEAQVLELYPQFRVFVTDHSCLLNDKEYKTCILVRAGFKPKNISNMLHVSPSYVSNIRTEMLQKLFGKTGTPKAFDELIREMK